MKIATTYANGEIFQHFGHTSQFKLYDVENGKVKVAGPEPKYHKVKSGDTIERIARKHGVSQLTIFKLNGLNSRSIIRPGQNLRYQ